MKNLKLFAISIAVLLIAVFTGCAGLTLVSVETDTVEGPKQVRQGMDISSNQITIWGVYKDGNRKVVTNIAQSNIIFNKHTPGPQTVKVRVGGLSSGTQEVSFQTEVMALRTLTVASEPRKKLFKEGDDADPSWPGLEIRGEWEEMGSHVVALASCEVTGFRKDATGIQTIKVTYEGIQTTFDVEVRGMVSIELTQPPTKLDYLQGDPLDLTGIQVLGKWGDGIPDERLTIARSDVTGFNENNVGVQNLTVTKNGKIVNFTVEVLGLTSINVDKPPTKTDYYYGEQIDLTGMLVYGYYTGSDPTKSRQVVIPNEEFEVIGFDPERVGRQQRVELRYKGIMTNFFVNQLMPPAAPAAPSTTAP